LDIEAPPFVVLLASLSQLFDEDIHVECQKDQIDNLESKSY
jgi:hypothetical protein